MFMIEIDRKNVILTGAAGGIGREIARQLAKEGKSLALIDRHENGLISLYQEIRGDAPDSLYICVDIADGAGLQDAVKLIYTRFSAVHVLINNAAIQAPIGSFHEVDPGEWNTNIMTNLLGPVQLTSLVVRGMIQQKYGKIINLSGGGSANKRPQFSAYAVSKTGLMRFTETIAEELRQYHIDVNAVSPGAINTGMLDEVLHAGERAGSEYHSAVLRKEIGGDDVRNTLGLIGFLVSSDSDGITGKMISSQYDPWSDPEYQDRLRSDEHLATLRRIDGRMFGQVQ
jgi:NAD(P)-dependent dehydrogenase (short-subunit alcohol dehydrogenase family)